MKWLVKRDGLVVTVVKGTEDEVCAAVDILNVLDLGYSYSYVIWEEVTE